MSFRESGPTFPAHALTPMIIARRLSAQHREGDVNHQECDNRRNAEKVDVTRDRKSAEQRVSHCNFFFTVSRSDRPESTMTSRR